MPPADDEGPEERNNWNAILKWSLAQTDEDAGATTTSARQPISEEDRQWFLQAMQSGMVDEIKRMKLITQALALNTGDVLDAEDVGARLELLEELMDRVCSIDNGGDLHTIGGLVPLIHTCAASPHASLRAAAAEVLATTVQNHPKAQDSALDNGALGPLLKMAAGQGGDVPPTSGGGSGGGEGEGSGGAGGAEGAAHQGGGKEGEEEEVSGGDEKTTKAMVQCRVKALLGLSCLLRGSDRAQEAFKLGEGFALLRDCLRVDHAKVRTKALHLARHLVTLNMNHMAAGVEAGYIVAAAAALAGSLPSKKETSSGGGGGGEEGGGDATEADIAAGQVREAALRLLLDMAKCVDFEKIPKAVDHFRSALVARSLAAASASHRELSAEDRDTFLDEINLTDELLKMFA